MSLCAANIGSVGVTEITAVVIQSFTNKCFITNLRWASACLFTAVHALAAAKATPSNSNTLTHRKMPN
ncbi:MAG: hypothetical protein IPG51_15290 [Chloroflexi bacterium]|nr:hypothetical protein [Chloroflexota bacterium]